jgi:cell division protein FtsQ
MKAEVIPVPAARTWRDIPQPMKPRAMSRGGRWRRSLAGARVGALVVLCGGFGWGAWEVAGTLGGDPGRLPAVARAVPIRHFELKTSAGGVLDAGWLERIVALPRGTTLPELDLGRLQEKLLQDRQVATARLERQFPDRLRVTITERVPVARVRIADAGRWRDLLVAPDGHLFRGAGYEPELIGRLPWLGGVALLPEGAGFRPLPGLAPVVQLLADAQFSAPHLSLAWQSVSLARLTSDREIEVTTKEGTIVVFGATGDYFVQLATLDYLLDRLAGASLAGARIDLTLGRVVPVTPPQPAAAVPEPTEARPGSAPAAARPAYSFFPIPPSKS